MAACAMATGNWTTGKIQMGTINSIGAINKINGFLDATRMHPDIPNGAFYPTPKVTDASVTTSAALADLAAIAIATINTIAAMDIAKKQMGIARDYYNLARNKWDRFRSIYMPCEQREMAEACNTPIYDPQYDTMASLYMQQVDRQWDDAQDKILSAVSTYCLPTDISLGQDIALMQSQVRGDSGNFAYRREEARADAKNDVRWNRRSQALNRGRDLQSTAASYAEAAANAYGQFGEMVGKAAEGATYALGYFSNRKGTTYPNRFSTIPSGSHIGDGYNANIPSTNYNIGYDLLGTNSGPLGNYGLDASYYSNSSAIDAATAKQNPGG